MIRFFSYRGRCTEVISLWWLQLVFCVFSSIWLRIEGFEVYAEQQILTLNDPARAPSVDYNNSEYGSTHIDDYWSKIDINHSPIDGWSLYRHVRIGCMLISEAPVPGTFLEKQGAGLSNLECVNSCNNSLTFYRYAEPPIPSTCICELKTDSIRYSSVRSEICPPESWDVFREYDYRASMAPAAYDVPRRLLYQIVTMRFPWEREASLKFQHYIHAVNALEAKPKFEFDTPLDRMVFNPIWDFGKSRMVSLSFSDDSGSSLENILDFTIISFNASSGTLKVQQEHFPIQRQIEAVGLEGGLSLGFASADGLATVDILFGTYYTVVPAMIPESTEHSPSDCLNQDSYVRTVICRVVHVIIAIDIDKKRVMYSRTLPITLMNMQINALTHVLYGAGADMSFRSAYFELCTATNQTILLGGVIPTRTIVVSCDPVELAPLPDKVNLMYLQSAAIDHQYNYAWFTYKQEAIGRPLVMEVHQNDAKLETWRENSLPLEAAYTTLVQTAPRIIFSLYAPVITRAQFDTSGTIIYIEFNTPTLRGAIPVDTNNDEIPDIFYDKDKVTGRVDCSVFFNDFTMLLIRGSMCQWTTDSSLYIELSPDSTITPGDLVRLRGNRVYAGKISASGVYLFSQPSTDFTEVTPPDHIPYPDIRMSGNFYLDECTELILDATSTTGHGFRGKFRWVLNRSEPAISEPLTLQLNKVIEDKQPVGQTPQMIRIPRDTLLSGIKYFFTLTVSSFFDQDIQSQVTKMVTVSTDPVPPLLIYGATHVDVMTYNPFTLASHMNIQEGCAAVADPTVTYQWTGCNPSDGIVLVADIRGCPSQVWDQQIFASKMVNISGVGSKTLVVKPWTFQSLDKYMFTVKATMTQYAGTKRERSFSNYASVEVNVSLGPIYAAFRGGTNGLAVLESDAIVIDSTRSTDPSDPENQLGIMSFKYTCRQKISTAGQGPSCFPGLNSTLPYIACEDVRDSSGAVEQFQFNGASYDQADKVTTNRVASDQFRYCMQQGGAILIIQRNYFSVGPAGKDYIVEMDVEKTVLTWTRRASSAMELEVSEDTGDRRNPLVHVEMLTRQPFVTGKALRFEGEVTNLLDGTAYSYAWTIYSFGPNPEYDSDRAQTEGSSYDVKETAWVPVASSVIDLNDPEDIRTPPGSRFLVTVPNKLLPGVQYKIRLTVTDTVLLAQNAPNAEGWAEVRFLMGGNKPSGGKLTSSNLTGVEFETQFRFSMIDWGSTDLPLAYQFAYLEDPGDDFAHTSVSTLLTPVFSAQRETTSVLPAGKHMPNHRLRVIGWVKSHVGATQSSSLILSVTPTTNPNAVLELLDNSRNLDPESAMKAGIMVAQNCEPNCPHLDQLLDNFEHTVVEAEDGEMPVTPELCNTQGHFLTMLSTKGLKTDRMITNMDRVTNLSVRENFIRVEDSYNGVLADTNVVLGVFGMLDSMLPVSGTAGNARRLQASSGSQDDCSEEVAPHLRTDHRSNYEKYRQLESLRTMERRLGNILVNQMAVGESPANFSVRNHDYAVGKEFPKAEESMATMYDPIMQKFRMPSLDNPKAPNVISYFYTEYKTFPYDFIALPPNRSLYAPVTSADNDNAVAKKIPLQGYHTCEATWYAMSLQLGDSKGDSIEKQVSSSLAGASFSLLPIILAHASDAVSTENAASCFKVDMGSNVSEANFDAKGVVYNNQFCVADKIGDFVVLYDNLASDLDFIEIYHSDGDAFYVDEHKTMAMVSSLGFVLLLSVIAAAFAVYWDEIQYNVEPIDRIKSRTVDMPDPREKMIATIAFAFRRNHLVIGFGQRHRKLTRDKRVWAILVTWLSVMAIATILHTKADVYGRQNTFTWVATGIVAGVLSFPITQLIQFLYEWRPESKLLSMTPSTSAKPQPLPLKLQAQVPVINRPARPPIPTVVLPPPAHAPPRIQLGLPFMPPGLPPLTLDNTTKPPTPPPPLSKTGPRPPHAPPPLAQLTAGNALPPLYLEDTKKQPAPPPRVPKFGPRPPKDPPPVSQLKAGDALSIMKPYGLTLPELPKLMAPNSATLPGGGVPAPPAKPKGGPKPPKAPPPAKKAIPVQPPGSLPALPLRRPDELEKIKLSGPDSARRGFIAPPPPPPRALLDFDAVAPQAPETPRSSDEEAFKPIAAIPGVPDHADHEDQSKGFEVSRSTTPLPVRQFREVPLHGSSPRSQWSSPRTESDSHPPEVSGRRPTNNLAPESSPRRDVEALPPEVTSWMSDEEHGMMPGNDRCHTPLPPFSPNSTQSSAFLPGALGLSGTFGPGDLPNAVNTSPPSLPPQRPPPQRPPMGLPPGQSQPKLPQLPIINSLGPKPMPWKVGMPPPPPPKTGMPLPPSILPSSSNFEAGLKQMPLFKLGPRTREAALPPLPKVALPLSAPLAHINQHTRNMPPPPPPPRRMEESIRSSEIPPPPDEDEPVVVRRTMARFKGDVSLRGKPMPKPPPKRQEVFAPKPPSGVPPANAYVLPRKVQDGMDDDLLKKAPQASEMVPLPPEPTSPVVGGFRFAEPPQSVDALKKDSDAKVQPKPSPQGGSAGLAKSRDPWPVPDWVVFVTGSLVSIFMLGLVFECSFFIIFFGSYMTSAAVWATHGATFVGFTMNLVLFESIKCFVVAMVALAQDATTKRHADIAARRARMALKAQRLQQPRSYNLRNWRWRQDAPLPSIQPPPLLG